MSVQDIKTFALAIVLGLPVLWLFWYALRQELLIHRLRKTGRVLTSLPKDATLYFDTSTKKKCKRCSKGKIFVRKRYRTAGVDDGKVVLSVLARIHWCNHCKYRNTSLEEDSKD
jgi:hypothetical protein